MFAIALSTVWTRAGGIGDCRSASIPRRRDTGLGLSHGTSLITSNREVPDCQSHRWHRGILSRVQSSELYNVVESDRG